MTLLAIRDRHEGRKPHASRYRARGDSSFRPRVRSSCGKIVSGAILPGAEQRLATAEAELRVLKRKADPVAVGPVLSSKLVRKRCPRLA